MPAACRGPAAWPRTTASGWRPKGADGADGTVAAAVDAGQPVADARLQAVLAFTGKLIERPIEGDKAAVQSLAASGLSTPAIVAMSQLIAFLSYQIRLAAGLQALAAAEANA
jgi:uncharacterized protein YciW